MFLFCIYETKFHKLNCVASAVYLKIKFWSRTSLTQQRKSLCDPRYLHNVKFFSTHPSPVLNNSWNVQAPSEQRHLNFMGRNVLDAKIVSTTSLVGLRKTAFRSTNKITKRPGSWFKGVELVLRKTQSFS